MDEIHFIDYEYASANYQAFDIGNFFTEFGGQEGYNRTLYPEKEFQLSWLRTYLQEYKLLKGEKDSKVTESEIEKLYVEVNQFALASLLLWGLWALIQSTHSTIDFDFTKFGVDRLGMYVAKRGAFLQL